MNFRTDADGQAAIASPAVQLDVPSMSDRFGEQVMQNYPDPIMVDSGSRVYANGSRMQVPRPIDIQRRVWSFLGV